MDEDGQHKPEDLLMLVAQAASSRMVVGVRAKASKLRVPCYAADALDNVYTYITEHHFTNMAVFFADHGGDHPYARSGFRVDRSFENGTALGSKRGKI